MRIAETLPNFVAIEGIDGAGTTTQLARLSERHKQTGIPVWGTCEPTTDRIGKLIRSVLGGRYSVQPETLAHLFASDRNEHIYGRDNGILAHLERGERVITDRYLFSSLAYQSVECAFEFVASLNEDFPLPEYLFYIDVPLEVGAERSSSREAQEIFERLEFQRLVKANYERVIGLFDEAAMTVHVLDGTFSAEAITVTGNCFRTAMSDTSTGWLSARRVSTPP